MEQYLYDIFSFCVFMTKCMHKNKFLFAHRWLLWNFILAIHPIKKKEKDSTNRFIRSKNTLLLAWNSSQRVEIFVTSIGLVFSFGFSIYYHMLINDILLFFFWIFSPVAIAHTHMSDDQNVVNWICKWNRSHRCCCCCCCCCCCYFARHPSKRCSGMITTLWGCTHTEFVLELLASASKQARGELQRRLVVIDWTKLLHWRQQLGNYKGIVCILRKKRKRKKKVAKNLNINN